MAAGNGFFKWENEKMFSLTIEQKILLAEKVMGLQKISHEVFFQRLYFQQLPDVKKELTGFFCATNYVFYPTKEATAVYVQMPDDEDWREWQPETDEGDAVRLMLALPILELHKFIDGTIRATTNCHTLVRSNDFCETICRLALAHAEELKNEQ